MHGFTYPIISSERKRNITYSPTHVSMWQILSNPFCGFEKVNCVELMFIHSCSYRKNIGIKNDVFWRKIDFLYQNFIRSFTYFNTSIQGVGLSIFIKGHHDDSCSITANCFGLLNKDFFPLFQTDGIHYTLSLHYF